MYAPRIQILSVKAFEDEFREERYIIIYAFYGCLIEILTYVPRERSKGRFRRRLKEVTIYIMSTSESALPVKYSEYADVFFEDKINNISPITRIDHVIDFEKNSIIFYKFIYYLSERELTILR
jgi:hypothetical protein